MNLCKSLLLPSQQIVTFLPQAQNNNQQFQNNQNNQQQLPVQNTRQGPRVVIEEKFEEDITPTRIIEETIIEDATVPEQGGNSIEKILA